MDKLEKHIKQTLEQRELQPSDSAWDKIESQIEDVDPKPKPFAKWYAVAAVFLGVVLAISMFWKTDDPAGQIKVIDVENDMVKIPKEKEVDVLKEEVGLDAKITENQTHEPEQNVIVAGNTTSKNKEPIGQVAQTNGLNDGLPEQKQLLIDQKVNEVFTKVSLLESNNAAITDAEVDSLLRAAQREILADKIFEENGSVDAMALLNEVEDELDASFRDQIFEALKDGYTKLKTAVADRNN